MTAKDFCIFKNVDMNYEVALKDKPKEILGFFNDIEECNAFIYGYIEGIKQINKEALRRSMNSNCTVEK